MRRRQTRKLYEKGRWLRDSLYKEGTDLGVAANYADHVFQVVPATASLSGETRRLAHLCIAVANDIAGGLARMNGDIEQAVQRSETARQIYVMYGLDEDADRMLNAQITSTLRYGGKLRAPVLGSAVEKLRQSSSARMRNEGLARHVDLLAVWDAADARELLEEARLIELSEKSGEDPALTAGRLVDYARLVIRSSDDIDVAEDALDDAATILSEEKHPFYVHQLALGELELALQFGFEELAESAYERVVAGIAGGYYATSEVESLAAKHPKLRDMQEDQV